MEPSRRGRVPRFLTLQIFYESASATIDGVSGYSIGGAYYAIAYPLSVDFSLPNSVFGSSNFPLVGPGSAGYYFTTISSVPSPTNPYQDDIIGGFVPGIYQLQLLSVTPAEDFTLTINQQTNAATTPEPSSLLLLATGALSLAALADRRARTGRLRAI